MKNILVLKVPLEVTPEMEEHKSAIHSKHMFMWVYV